MIGADAWPAATDDGRRRACCTWRSRTTRGCTSRSTATRSPSRPSFGVETAFDVDTAGTGVLGYERDPSRSLWLAVQAVLWIAVLAVGVGAQASFVRRRAANVYDETLIDLTGAPPISVGVAGEVLGLPVWDDERRRPRRRLDDVDTIDDAGGGTTALGRDDPVHADGDASRSRASPPAEPCRRRATRRAATRRRRRGSGASADAARRARPGGARRQRRRRAIPTGAAEPLAARAAIDQRRAGDAAAMTKRRIPLLLIVLLAIAGTVMVSRDAARRRARRVQHGRRRMDAVGAARAGAHRDVVLPRRAGDRRRRRRRRDRDRQPHRRAPRRHDPRVQRARPRTAGSSSPSTGGRWRPSISTPRCRARWSAAVVEVEGGGALVEQQAFHPSGDSSAACANATSDTWYLADGFTVDGSLDQIVLTNPYDQTVVASLEFATREGSRAPGSYSGLTVPARSTRVIDLGAPGAGAQGEPILAVSVTSTRGRLVVGRSQRFLGGGRLGTQVTLASPAPRDQWWFANGRKGAGHDRSLLDLQPHRRPTSRSTPSSSASPRRSRPSRSPCPPTRS